MCTNTVCIYPVHICTCIFGHVHSAHGVSLKWGIRRSFSNSWLFLFQETLPVLSIASVPVNSLAVYKPRVGRLYGKSWKLILLNHSADEDPLASLCVTLVSRYLVLRTWYQVLGTK